MPAKLPKTQLAIHLLPPSPLARILAGMACCALLTACGGSGGDNAAPPASSQYQAGVFPPSSDYLNFCAEPTDGENTQTGQPYRQGSQTDENNWLRSWSNELYLWYDELPDINPANFSTPEYFELMKTTAITANGNPRDQHHFTIPTPEYLESSRAGRGAGYGAQVTWFSTRPPRELVVAYTQPGTPATQQGLSRGARILSVDGVDIVNSNDVDTINAGLFPAEAGETHTFEVQDQGSSTSRTITLVSAQITSDPVQNVTTIATGSGTVGYMSFHDHNEPAEAQLISAINQLSAASVSDLILDLRYNGGGFLYIASQLAYMIAGGQTAGASFERLSFNDKHPDTDPVTGQPLEPIPFYNTSTDDDRLPTLGLDRVFVLTGSNTCSASESIINGLRGIGVQVLQFGATTCGKPYGFYPTDNCATTYFSIQFRGENNQGFGDYPDGFSPANASEVGSVSLPGCEVADDFSAALGDSSEARLAAALEYRQSGVCPSTSAISTGAAGKARARLQGKLDGETPKPVWLQNRILGRP